MTFFVGGDRAVEDWFQQAIRPQVKFLQAIGCETIPVETHHFCCIKKKLK